MSRRKGELTPSQIDVGWPYQVAIRGDLYVGKQAEALRARAQKLLYCPRGHSVFHDDIHYDVHCFATKPHAEAFMAEFGGEWFDPKDRGKGVNWNKWYRGSLSGAKAPNDP